MASVYQNMSTSGPNELATDVDKPLAYSNRVLSQAEGVGINFYTLNFCRFACGDVRTSTEGQRIFNSCLLNVSEFAALDERLQFGFGEKNLLRNAGVQLYEYEHLLLASALTEFFAEDYVASVFSALADYYEDEDRPKPRLTSFRSFVRSTNGLLSFSRFPLDVDDRIRLNPYADHDRGNPHATRTTEFVPVDQVAAALRMLGQLKQGKIKELTFIGGDLIGWFSAFIEMFLGISQTLFDQDGNILYQSNGQTIAVNLRFVSPETAPSGNDPSTVWLRKPINASKRSDLIPPKLTGRVIGEAMFSKVFGPAFHRLDQTEAKAFGNALGGTARSLQFLAKDEDAPPTLFSQENKSDPDAFGLGLISTWTNWFPELRHLQGRMERSMKKTWEEARQQCEDSIKHLEPHCGCYICSETKGPEENPTNLPKNTFCIPTMMETIIILGLTLSRVTLVPDLFPSRAGILAIYKVQVEKRLSIKSVHADSWDRFRILFGDDLNTTLPQRLRNVITLFSGSRPTQDLPDNLMAMSHEGMCAYVLKLQRGDHAAARSDDNLIRVVMGHINWRQKIYNRLCLGCVQPPVEIGSGWESFKCTHYKERIYVK